MLSSFQVHGVGCLQKKPHRSPHCHRKGNSWTDVGHFPFPSLSPVSGNCPGWGTLAAAHRHCSSFAPESFSSYFWVAAAFLNVCFGVGACPCSQLGLPACSLLC